MKNFMKILLSNVALALCFVACGRAAIDQKQLVGKWVLHKDDRRPENARRANSSTLFLSENGRLDVINFPRDIFFSRPLGSDVVSNVSGKWRLAESVNGQQVIELVFERGENLEGRLPYGVRLFVFDRGGALALTYYHGDPDTDPRLDFIKEP